MFRGIVKFCQVVKALKVFGSVTIAILPNRQQPPKMAVWRTHIVASHFSLGTAATWRYRYLASRLSETALWQDLKMSPSCLFHRKLRKMKASCGPPPLVPCRLTKGEIVLRFGRVPYHGAGMATEYLLPAQFPHTFLCLPWSFGDIYHDN